MADENALFEALASSGFKVSIHDKKRTDALEIETERDTKKQYGEDLHPTSASDHMEKEDTKSLLSIFKNMSESQRKKVINTLKECGLDDPLTKDKIIQNSFTVEKTIREMASN
jgi:hypothetical protein